MPKRTQKPDEPDKEVSSKETSVLISLYESAMIQSHHEGDLIWSKFSGFIVTNTIFFGIIGQIITSKTLNNPNQYVVVLSSVGFLLSFFWLISTKRGYETLYYWQYTGIEIASKIFNSLKKSKLENYYKNGKSFFVDSKEVSFDFDYDKKKLSRSILTSIYLKIKDKKYFINTEWTAYLSILLIMLLYVIVFILSLNGREFSSQYSIYNKTHFPQYTCLFN